MTRWSWRLSATNDAPIAESLNRSAALAVQPLDLDVGRERHAAEVEPQRPTRPKVYRVRGFQQNATQANVEETDRNWKRQNRQLCIGNHGAGDATTIGRGELAHGPLRCKEVANFWEPLVFVRGD